jgi:high affinity Mn2+ porin
MRVLLIAVTVLSLSRLMAQSSDPPPAEAPASENWNLYYQATSIGQNHGTFNSPYTGPLSLQDYREDDVSLTTTLFFDARLAHNLQFVFDPEIAGGRGFSSVDGLANPSNGELPRVATATPKPYIARLYLTYDFGFGSETEHVESDDNQLAGDRPLVRYTITVGRFSLTDFFDNNAYTHDPRSQFMAWGVMYNGAWDYPADTRGYTWGWVHELHTRNWSFRYASAAEPSVANGGRFDRRLLVDLGTVFEQERRYSLRKHPGTVRLLEYFNHTHSGSYAAAIKLGEETGTTPNVDAVKKWGTLKYGSGVNLEQEITSDMGLFMRLGWNDGKTQDYAFTAIDRLATGGISVKGTKWKRKEDVVATSFTASGASGVHALYLARGGLDFLIGDGRLNYAPEYVWESYYSAKLFRGFFATFDLQHDTNLAFNHDRGPVWIESVRLHMEFGLHPWSAR